MNNRRLHRSGRFSCGLLLVLVVVPSVLTWHVWRQEKLNRALILAIKSNEPDSVAAFLHEGANPDARDTGVDASSFWQHLRERIVDRSQKDQSGDPALLVAVTWIERNDAGDHSSGLLPDAKIVKALLDAGANPNITDAQGRTALMRAIEEAVPAIEEAVPLLLQRKANIDAKDSNGLTALMIAAKDDDISMTRLLLAHGASVNTKANDGSTALILAADFKDIVRELLAHHADPHVRAENIGTALGIALAHNSFASIRLLEKAGGEP